MPVLPVLVMGSCPGVGKTTLIDGLLARLEGDGKRVELFREEAVLEHPAFAAVTAMLRAKRRVVPEELLAASEAYVRGWASLNADVVLVDSLFPFVNSLFASGAAGREIVGFVHRLWSVVEPARPLTLYVDGDAAVALERARRGRGDKWMAAWMVRVRRWRVETHLTDADAVAGHFERERAFTLRVLEAVGWHYTRLDTRTRTPEELADTALGMSLARL
jgi:thymidylate kinase